MLITKHALLLTPSETNVCVMMIRRPLNSVSCKLLVRIAADFGQNEPKTNLGSYLLPSNIR